MTVVVMSRNKTLQRETYQVSHLVCHISSHGTRQVFLLQTGDTKHIECMAAKLSHSYPNVCLF